MLASQPLVEREAEEAEEAEAAADFLEEEQQLDMGQAQSEAAARLAEDEAHVAESMRAAVVVGQEGEEDATVWRGAPGLDAGAADAASGDQSNVSAAGDCRRASWSPVRVTHAQSARNDGRPVCRIAAVQGSHQPALGRAL